TPSFIGRWVVRWPGVRPSICLASLPTAATALGPPLRSWRMATTDGSLSTMPWPRTKMRVLAVPRSMDRSLENMPRNFLNIGGARPSGGGGNGGIPGENRIIKRSNHPLPRQGKTPRPTPCGLARRDGGANLCGGLAPKGSRRRRRRSAALRDIPEKRRPTGPATAPRSISPMPALICGSLAYDTIMVFPDQFKNHILPDKVHILNVSFLVPRMRREFGGCAGNIAYNLKLLGGDPIPMATVGQDFGPYREYFAELGIPLGHVREIPELFTPQAFITTDLDNNQITAFHPGAM